MNKQVLGLFIYAGLTLFFAVNAISVLRDVSVLSSVARGLVAFGVFIVLGLVAGIASNAKDETVEAQEEPESQ